MADLPSPSRNREGKAPMYSLTRSIIYDCPAIVIDDSLVKIGNAARVIALKGATQEDASLIANALRATRCAEHGHVWVGTGDERVVCDDCGANRLAVSESEKPHSGLVATLETMADEGAMIHCLSWMVIQGALRQAASALKNAAPQASQAAMPESPRPVLRRDASDTTPADAAPSVASAQRSMEQFEKQKREATIDDDPWDRHCPRCGATPDSTCGWPNNCPTGLNKKVPTSGERGQSK